MKAFFVSQLANRQNYSISLSLATVIGLSIALHACTAPEDEPCEGRAKSVEADLSKSERTARYTTIRATAASRGILRTGYLLAGIAYAETGMAHCWSEATWACKGPNSKDCGGGPVIAGSGDGACSLKQGGLGMFQFDAGTFTDTLNKYGSTVLLVSGNVNFAINYAINMVKISKYTTNAETDAKALQWIANFDYGNSTLRDQWIKTVTHYYNGCTPSASCWSQRYAHYNDSLSYVVNDTGLPFWVVEKDTDADGVPDSKDNCDSNANADQKDTDKDGKGDVCDTDDDADGLLDTKDNCPLIPNKTQVDTDKDGKGDACDTDDDGDGVLDTKDNCPLVANKTQVDTDKDGKGDGCDDDTDGDTILNAKDNCPIVANTNQADSDKDGKGDACDTDDDGDGIPDASDNCKSTKNADQSDVDKDGKGDDCDEDADGDGILNAKDNCSLDSNKDQADADKDGKGDACDDDIDADGIDNDEDNCPVLSNPDQADADSDGTGDACDTDQDGDGVSNDKDNCPKVINPGQEDEDGDGLGDACTTPKADTDAGTEGGSETDSGPVGKTDSGASKPTDPVQVSSSDGSCAMHRQGENKSFGAILGLLLGVVTSLVRRRRK